MTQFLVPALALIALAALVAAALLARGRSRAAARAEAAEAASGLAAERARAAEGQTARAEQQAREAGAEARQAAVEASAAADRALAAEDRAHRAENRAAEAGQRTAEADHRAAAADLRADTAEQRAAAAEAGVAALLAEIGHLATERVAAAALRLSHPNAPIAGPLDAAAVGPAAVQALQAVLDAASAAVTDERERVDAAARSAMRGATSKIQTLLYQIQSLVQQLQDDNDDPRLLEVDFRNEVALRRIQTVAVLCEAWPGLARTDSPLAEVVVGALSRVPGYARIKVANHLREGRLAVVARAAEPVAIAVAELLANATAYSHPETDVPVTLQQGGRGALVIVDDSGIGMEEDQLRRARRLLAGPSDVLLTELGNPPRTGFAVVGKLARQYGFSCHVEPSPYGGMRALVRIPAGLLTVVDEQQPLSVLTPLPLRAGSGPAGPAPAPGGRAREGVPAIHVVPPVPDLPDPSDGAPVHAVPPVRAVPDEPAAPDDGTGLPSRRRRRPVPAQPSPADGAAAPAPGAVRPVRTPEQAAARWQALQHGTGSGRAAVAEAEAVTAEAADTEAAGTEFVTAEAAEADTPQNPHSPSPEATGPAVADRAATPRPDAAHTGAGPAAASGRRSTQTS
ncbi:ATP-binding protein [Kitasatospora purpeofusca]|uniref:ATP-binding protein n=1 Tax=Kitasatospora purpeofusca TaxID=67352 RepID=UPI002254D54B|nr:ATP-binding protein [Kitasatospora purpeofusca]MCX4757478.1 ATP-binding protein [Kitasatospora purpeofusca]WSR34796.1 ATP-binding protein [Kitasatospora purpeofusca]